MCSWLVAHPADIAAADAEGFTALTWACVKGHRAAVGQLVNCRADCQAVTESNGKTPLSLTAERGHMDCIRELLERKCSLEKEKKNRDGTTALMVAAHHNETDVI